MTIAEPSMQMPLLEVSPAYPLGTNAHARNAYGSAAQEIVCKALGLQTIAINGNCEVCFDAKKDDTYYEIKSVRGMGKLVLYKWRIKKEAESGAKLNYAIFSHKIKGHEDGKTLLQELARNKPEIFIFPAADVHAIAKKLPIHKIKNLTVGNEKAGYNRTGYREGYHMPKLIDIVHRFDMTPRLARFFLYETPFVMRVWERTTL